MTIQLKKSLNRSDRADGMSEKTRDGPGVPDGQFMAWCIRALRDLRNSKRPKAKINF